MDYSPYKGLRGSPFVGLDIFRQMFTMRETWPIFRNTVVIAVGKIVFGQLANLTFALLVHQVTQPFFKRFVQTLTTLPHFISWVVIGSAMVQLLSTSGGINSLIVGLGGRPIRFLGDVKVFPWTLILSETWKEFGFGSIIYLAALTAINPELYEAAAVDGAGPLARLLHVTIPGIAPTIILMGCLSLGQILNAGFEQVLVLQNPMVYATGDIIDTYVYRAGILETKYSLATAVGLLKAVVGFALILLSYWLADRLANYRIF